ncbi:hypothetical protein E8E13_010565 [Curvularia kusanoi]|uniref:RGS domain-containing protein n=1 Tax=Curvularia kusanoi TaxID=90978 RepID=A0A9P4WCC1_CURKU|nr:hypothetical protein E8E13_010565 [Curvularia kusanoi]
MDSMEGITIYNLPAQPPLWDRVGIFFVTFAAVWTTLVASGMVFCLWNRHIPALRVRSLPLAFSGIVLLHLYWCMAQIVYPIGRSMPVVIAYDVQYWIMGTWFPLGIALFHAANIRFLRVAELQKQFEENSPIASEKMRAGEGRKSNSWMGRWRSARQNDKVFIVIGVGMVFQCLTTMVMFLLCAKYHPSFGLPGTEITGEALQEQIIDLGRGWEWWPTVVWQFVWAWMVAPFLIWKAWDIRDTMGWRTQTIGACLSGLHATPMFLIASYCSVFYTSGVNSYFPPSQWLHLNTMFLEIFTIFIPVHQVFKHWRMQKLAAQKKPQSWATTSLATTVSIHRLSMRPESKHSTSKNSALELIDRTVSTEYQHSGDRLLTRTALMRVLSENPAPLQAFSARRDFSGENIAFLTRLSAWKDAFPTTETRQSFNTALQLYRDFVSPRDADFPLNLSSSQLKALDAVFKDAASDIRGEAGASTGDEAFEAALPFYETPGAASSGALSGKSGTEGLMTALRWEGEVPAGFGEDVFEDARCHVEQLVLTNTWPKFVREMRERSSIDSERSEESAGSQESQESAGSRKSSVGMRVERFVNGLRR